MPHASINTLTSKSNMSASLAQGSSSPSPPSSSSPSSSFSCAVIGAEVSLHDTLQNMLVSSPRSEVQAKIFTSDFSTSPHSAALRGMCWRLMLGVLQDSDGSIGKWVQELRESVVSYAALKSKLMPKVCMYVHMYICISVYMYAFVTHHHQKK